MWQYFQINDVIGSPPVVATLREEARWKWILDPNPEVREEGGGTSQMFKYQPLPAVI